MYSNPIRIQTELRYIGFAFRALSLLSAQFLLPKVLTKKQESALQKQVYLFRRKWSTAIRRNENEWLMYDGTDWTCYLFGRFFADAKVEKKHEKIIGRRI